MKTFVEYLNIICFNLIFLEKSYEFLILLQNHAWINICKVLRTIVVAYITIIPNHCKYSYYLKDMNLFKLKRNFIIFKSFLHILFIFQTEKHRCSILVLTGITLYTFQNKFIINSFFKSFFLLSYLRAFALRIHVNFIGTFALLGWTTSLHNHSR